MSFFQQSRSVGAIILFLLGAFCSTLAQVPPPSPIIWEKPLPIGDSADLFLIAQGENNFALASQKAIDLKEDPFRKGAAEGAESPQNPQNPAGKGHFLAHFDGDGKILSQKVLNTQEFQLLKAAPLQKGKYLVHKPEGFIISGAEGKTLAQLPITDVNYLSQPTFTTDSARGEWSLLGFAKDDRSHNFDGKNWSQKHERLWYVRFDAKAQLIFSKPIFDRGHPKEIRQILAMPDGGILACGLFKDSMHYGKQSVQSEGGWNIFLSRISPEGKVLWLNHYPISTRILKIRCNAEGFSTLLFNQITYDGLKFTLVHTTPDGQAFKVNQLKERSFEVVDQLSAGEDLILLALEQGRYTLLRIRD